MAITNHKDLAGLNIHTPITWEVADSTARLAIVPISVDLYKLAYQLDNQTVYILTSYSPVIWKTATTSDHTALINIGTNTHAQIDTDLTRLANTSGTNTGDQDLSGYELLSNKSTSVNTDQASSVKYPSVKSVYDWAIGLFIQKNSSITGATKTKITYDASGLVTSGTDATTADIADSTNKRYVTDAQLTVIGNTSGVNTGDQDLSGLVSAIGAKVSKAGDTMTGILEVVTTLATTDPLVFVRNLSPLGIASLLAENDNDNILTIGVTGTTVTGLPTPNDEAFIYSSNAINAVTTLAGGFKWHQDGTQVASIINGVFTANLIDAAPVNINGLSQTTPTVSDFVPFTNGATNYKASLNEMPVSAPQNLNSIVNAIIFG